MYLVIPTFCSISSWLQFRMTRLTDSAPQSITDILRINKYLCNH